MSKAQNDPRYLRKSLWCMALVILLQVLKKYLDDAYPGLFIFHHFVITELQVIILLWTIIILLIPSKRFITRLLVLIIIMAIPELLFRYWLYNPERIPISLQPVVSKYSTLAENSIIQYEKDKSIYDKDLFYTLKPTADFTFHNPEFVDSFHTNRMGLRDDDASLEKPEIISLGDSYAMGWGVEQEETYAEQLSKLSHKKVLNAGISSYGTARELGNLYRLDTSALQYIILQYCQNDLSENERFVKNDYALKISSKESFDSLTNINYWNTLWFPGKRAVCISKFWLERKTNPWLFPKKKPSADSILQGYKTAARYFTDILFRSAINFNKVKVLVINLNHPGGTNDIFVNEVNKLIVLPEYAARFNNNLIVIPTAELLPAEEHYILDAHLRASGHRKVAERLYKYMMP